LLNLEGKVKKLFSQALLISLFVTLASCGKKDDSTTKDSSPSNGAAPAVTVAQPEQLKFPLKVKDVGLGIVKAPCTPGEETYVDILQKPVRTQLECTLGSGADETQIIFSSDGKSVVRVLRKQYLMPSDPEPGAIVKSAVAFYGNPTNFDEGNWMANYGEAYTISYDGRRASTTMNDAGVGLLIKGYMCADGNWGTERCGNLGTSVIKYDLIDVEGYKKQIEDGKAAQASKQQSQISNQKF
jgi:hypothetical protein